MKRFVILIATLAISFTILTSCTYFAPNKAKVQLKEAGRVQELNSGARIANQHTQVELGKAQALLGTATVPTNNQPVTIVKTNFNQATTSLTRAGATAEVAEDMLRREENIIGKPADDQTKVVERLAGDDGYMLKQEELLVQAIKEKQEAGWIKKVNELEQKLQDYGTKYEQERNEKIMSYVKWGSILLLLIGGPIALMVLFPPLLGVLTSAIPALSGLFGVPAKITNGMVRGIGDMRYTLKQQAKYESDNSDAKPKLYTAAEVQAMLDEHLDEHLANDIKLVDHLRIKNNV